MSKDSLCKVLISEIIIYLNYITQKTHSNIKRASKTYIFLSRDYILILWIMCANSFKTNINSMSHWASQKLHRSDWRTPGYTIICLRVKSPILGPFCPDNLDPWPVRKRHATPSGGQFCPEQAFGLVHGTETSGFVRFLTPNIIISRFFILWSVFFRYFAQKYLCKGQIYWLLLCSTKKAG